MEELESSNGSIVGTIIVASCALVLSLSIALKHKREQYNRKSPLPQLRTNIHTMEFRDTSLLSDVHHKRGDRSKSLPYMRDNIFGANEKAKQTALREVGVSGSVTGNNKNAQGKEYATMYDIAGEHRSPGLNSVCDFYYHSLLAQSHVRPQSAQLTEWHDETLGISIPFSPILFSIASEERQAPLILLTFRYLRQEGHKITITIEKMAEPITVEEYRDMSLSNISSCAEILSTSMARIGSAQRPQAEYCYIADNELDNNSTARASWDESSPAHHMTNIQSSHYYNSNNNTNMKRSVEQQMENAHINNYDYYNSTIRSSQEFAPSYKEQTRYVLAVFVVFDTFAFTVQYVAPTRVRSILPTAFYELIRGIKVVDALPTTSYYLLTEPRLGLGIRLPLNFVITTDAINLFYNAQRVGAIAAAARKNKVQWITVTNGNENQNRSQEQELVKHHEYNKQRLPLEKKKKEVAMCSWSPLMIGASRDTGRIAFALQYEPPPHIKSTTKQSESSFTYMTHATPQYTIPEMQSTISRLAEPESESESSSSSILSSKSFSAHSSSSESSSPSSSSLIRQTEEERYYSVLEKYLTRQLYKSMTYFGLELLPSEESTCTSTTNNTKTVQNESKEKEKDSNIKSQTKSFTVAPDAVMNNDDTIGIVALRRWPVSAVRKWNETTLAQTNNKNESVLMNKSNNRVTSSFFFRRSVSNATARQKECGNTKTAAATASHSECDNHNVNNYARNDNKNTENAAVNCPQEQQLQELQESVGEQQTNPQTAMAAVSLNGKINIITNEHYSKKIARKVETNNHTNGDDVNKHHKNTKSIRHNRTKFRVRVKRANNINDNKQENKYTSNKVQNGFAKDTYNGEAKYGDVKENKQYGNVINIDARLYELSICRNGNFGAEYGDDDEYNDDTSHTYSAEMYKSNNGYVFHDQLHRSGSYAAHSSSWVMQQAYFCVNYVYVRSTASIAHLLIQHPLDTSTITSLASTVINNNLSNIQSNSNISNNYMSEMHNDVNNTSNLQPEQTMCRAIYVTFYVPVAPSEWANFHFLAAEQRHTVKEVISFATSVMRSLTLGNHYGQEPCVLYCNIRQRVMPFTIPLSSHWSCVDENIIEDPLALIRVRENDHNNYYNVMECGTLHDVKSAKDTIVIVRPFPLPMIKVKAANAQKHKRKINATKAEMKKKNVEATNSSLYTSECNVSRRYYSNNEEKFSGDSQYHSYQRRIVREVKRLLELYVTSLSEETFVSVLSCKSNLLANGSVAVIMVFGPPSYASRNASFAASQCKSEWSTSFASESSYTTTPASSPIAQIAEISFDNNQKTTTAHRLCTTQSVSSSPTDNYTSCPENSMEHNGQLTNEQLWEQQERQMLEEQKLEEITGSFNPLASYESLHEYYTRCHTRALREASLTVNNSNNDSKSNTMERKQEGKLSTSNVFYFPRTFTEADCVLESDHDCRVDSSHNDKPIRIAIVVCPAHLTENDGGNNNNNNNNITSSNSTCLSRTNTHAVPKALLFMAQTSIVNFHKTRNTLMRLVTQVQHLRSQTM